MAQNESTNKPKDNIESESIPHGAAETVFGAYELLQLDPGWEAPGQITATLLLAESVRDLVEMLDDATDEILDALKRIESRL